MNADSFLLLVHADDMDSPANDLIIHVTHFGSFGVSNPPSPPASDVKERAIDGGVPRGHAYLIPRVALSDAGWRRPVSGLGFVFCEHCRTLFTGLRADDFVHPCTDGAKRTIPILYTNVPKRVRDRAERVEDYTPRVLAGERNPRPY